MRFWHYNDIGDEITFSPITRCVDDFVVKECVWLVGILGLEPIR